MRTKEKLERSGWQFKKGLDYYYEIYGRGTERVIYGKRENLVLAYFDLFKGNFHFVDDIEFELLTDKL